jgi:4-hydroxy-3-polyprenylbenzoate decarboxylase
MPYKDLREFLRRIEKEGELARIREEVSPSLRLPRSQTEFVRCPRVERLFSLKG